MNTELRTILSEWRERRLPEIIRRDQSLDTEDEGGLRKATVVTGFRRSGKTYLLFAAIKKLLAKYSREEVIYVNFEDERIPQKTEILSQLLPEIRAVFGKKPRYLFLDEVQNIPNWSRWLRRILDTQEMKIFVTGSSSKMSSFELPTELRGRAWEVKVYPLNFQEFLRFKNKSFDWQRLSYLPEQKAELDFNFDEFLVHGSLPEVVLAKPEKKQELLQSYFQTVVRKEIIERFRLRNEESLKTLLKLLLNSTSITVSKLYNSLKSLGISVGKTAVNNYIAYIESSYFLKQLFYYSPSMRSQLQYPRKVYFIDNGFITALSTKFSKNYGRLFENFVFWQLRKIHEDLFYFRDDRGKEVDFVVMKDGRVESLYQVCFDLSDIETKEREIKSLLQAAKKFGCKNLFLVTKDALKEKGKTNRIRYLSLIDLIKS